VKRHKKVDCVFCKHGFEFSCEYFDSILFSREIKNDQHHDGFEVLIDKNTYLFGGESDEAIEMPAGIYRYIFSFPLYAFLPQSLESRYGFTRYSIEGYLGTSLLYEKKFNVKIKISRKDNFSGVLELADKLVKQYEISTKSFFSWSSIPIQATVSIPHSVFTPGSVIPITIHLNNESNRNFNSTVFELIQIIKFTR
jgi:hypothetical protein